MLSPSSSTTLFFFLSYILDIKSFSFLVLTPFSQLYFFFYTLHTIPLLFLLFLLFLFFSSMFLYSLYTLPLSPLSSILSQVRVYLLEVYSTLHSTPISFPIWDMHITSFFSSLFFNLNIWVLPLVVFYSSTPKILYFFLYCLLFSHLYFFSYSTLHYSTCYHFKFILGNQFPLHLYLLISTVAGQISRLSILPIHSSFSFFYLCF